MLQHADIKQFVRHALGCSCPDDVFGSIEYERLSGQLLRLKIGGRLLVDILTTGDSIPTQAEINGLLEIGVKERNTCGFNRFRLVLVTSQADSIQAQANQIFQQSDKYDERTHLHVLDPLDNTLAAAIPGDEVS